MRLRRGPVALVVLALAAEMAYIFIKGSKTVATAEKSDAEKEKTKK